jgi:hypothetical protein
VYVEHASAPAPAPEQMDNEQVKRAALMAINSIRHGRGERSLRCLPPSNVNVGWRFCVVGRSIGRSVGQNAVLHERYGSGGVLDQLEGRFEKCQMPELAWHNGAPPALALA